MRFAPTLAPVLAAFLAAFLAAGVLLSAACGGSGGPGGPPLEACSLVPASISLPEGTVRGACSPGLEVDGDGVCRGWRASSLALDWGHGTGTLQGDGSVLVVGWAPSANRPGGGVVDYDPTYDRWGATGIESGGDGRWGHTATRLPDGAVLIVGGAQATVLGDVVRFAGDGSGDRDDAAPLATPRWGHAAALLDDGRVLVAGGVGAGSVGTEGRALDSAEAYTPDDDVWAPTGTLETARALHTATRLPDGGVLVVAGEDDAGASLASCERFDAGLGRWSPAAALPAARRRHAAAALPDGRVLVAGGLDGAPRADAFLYDPVSDAWTSAAPLPEPRAGLTLTPLCDGSVVAVGGWDLDGGDAPAVVRYRPDEDRWAPFGALATARSGHATTLLADGGLVVTGGTSRAGGTRLAVERLVVETARWRTTRTALPKGREEHTATLLDDGRVLVTGGFGGKVLADTALFTPDDERWQEGAALTRPRRKHSATLLADGDVLVVGGSEPDLTPVDGAERWDTAADAWAAVAAPAEPRGYHSATRLPDGRVLVAGGVGAHGETLTSAEIYDPAADVWTPAAPMHLARSSHVAVSLADGRVFVVGGAYTPDTLLDARRAEVYDPRADRWTLMDGLGVDVIAPAPVPLPGGDVLLPPSGGGITQTVDPDSGDWDYVGRGDPQGVTGGRAALLPNDAVLMVGGRTNDGPTGQASVYDIAEDAWYPTGGLVVPRTGHTLTPLADGRLLVIGGVSSDYRRLAETEVYEP